ncbi:hypothetical protein MWU49_12385 [Alcanivorax sp. S6407]|uniref:outer membrane beta-barrel protein n=1 Tax=Alcanivorax sp. S6407 TaxID=2926424 RepID=UPI001FF628C0|nr:hypothetical protein [Alcanivorax sp. S6407]MCK0154507.1 hypothetical protein [Alcanivorax sp. S6407]
MRRLLTATLCLLLLAPFSQAGQFRFNTGLTAGRFAVDLDASTPIPEELNDDRAAGLYLYLGYQTNSRFLLDIGASTQSNVALMNVTEGAYTRSIEALAGYALQWKALYIEPKAGYAQWRDVVKESEEYSMGQPQEFEQEGQSPVYVGTLGLRFTPNTALALSYRSLALDDEPRESLMLGISTRF